MDNELNEPYNNMVIQRKDTQNKILHTRITLFRLKGYSGASSHFMREEDQQCLENIINATVPMIVIPDSGTL